MASAQAGSSSATSSNPPILAAGDWTKNLVHLAKTAELKKHALTLQLHTAHILSAHASLDQKSKTIQDMKEQKNKLDSERMRLLNCLRQVNEDRDQADLMEATLNKECDDLRHKIQAITDGEYASAKADVDRLRQELGQSPLPSLQQTLEEKSQQYVLPRRPLPCKATAAATAGNKRAAEDSAAEGQPVGKRPRGRPKGSKTNKNKGKDATGAAAGTAGPTPAS
ncbi:hypothetical protein IEO21_02369 [Rhodonia placenta]|uniref:Uncharacterized protein n=2 Tax=Rhodonia placenta TaxID=104341 RepID=A0A8H7P7N5_9APHY|nr:hypothetical protein IEO21_02369 [Postia placenta]